MMVADYIKVGSKIELGLLLPFEGLANFTTTTFQELYISGI